MKKILPLVIGLFSVFTSLAQTEIINIPDPNFKNALLTHDLVIDTNGDGEIQQSEAQVVTFLNVSNKNITDLSGIEYFTNLKILDCFMNELIHLDVTHNLALERLSCSRNKLTHLDVTHNLALERLSCSRNKLTDLDVTKNLALKSLHCGANPLTDLDITKNLALESLDCYSTLLVTLDVTKNTALKELSCGGNPLTDLDLTHNLALEHLSCGKNQLTSLNLTKNAALRELNCYYNSLTDLDLTHNLVLERLSCERNQLTSLKLPQNTTLEYLNCFENQLTDLDLTKSVALEFLDCSKNQLAYLDLTQNSVLERLFCRSNPLTSLNLANGNNRNIFIMTTEGCSNLTCIQIDEGFTPPASRNTEIGAIGWKKDDNTSYSTDCGSVIAEIYPNPVTDIVYLEAIEPITEVTIYNLSGGEIFSLKETQSVDVSELPNGVYFIEINTISSTIVKKFVKK